MHFTAGHLEAGEACTTTYLFSALENEEPCKRGLVLNETLLYDKKVSKKRYRGRKQHYWRGVKRVP
jgi:hypothetical protein